MHSETMWVLVPTKVTNEMIDAANNVPPGIAGSPSHWQWVWDAMLDAVPASGQGLTDERIAEISAEVAAQMFAESLGFRIISSEEFDLQFARALLSASTTASDKEH